MESQQEAVARFASVARLLEDALLLVSRDGEILWANEACTRLLSTSPESFVNRQLSQFASADVEALLRGASRSSRFVPGALTLVVGAGRSVVCRCDGALYRAAPRPALIALRLAPKEQAGSEFIVLSEKIRELSAEVGARRRAEEQARALGGRFKVTLESIGDAVISTDKVGRITFMNAVAERLTGWPAAAASGRHLDEVFVILGETSGAPVESPVAKVLRLGHVVGLANHTVLVRRDGQKVPIDDSGAPIKGDAGDIEGVVLVFRDLSDRHALERDLLAKTERLEEADRRKNDYLSMLAHELRNPLAPIANGIEILKRGLDEPVRSRVIGTMSRQLHHMVRIVDDLLDVSRITQGKFDLRMGEVHLPELLVAAEDLAKPLFDAAGVRLERTVQPPQLALQGDGVRLVQLLGNLLANAAKFSSRGQTVRLDARVADRLVVIAVQDEGVGVAPEQLEKIFEVFYQADQGLGRERGGLGIGLAICRSVAAMHGGTIRAQSDGIGRGSTFTVTLPFTR